MTFDEEFGLLDFVYCVVFVVSGCVPTIVYIGLLKDCCLYFAAVNSRLFRSCVLPC